MAVEFVSLDEAAQLLGISAEELSALREQHEVSGYRDGPTWKFKRQDIDSLKDRQKAELSTSDSGELFDLPLDLGEDDLGVLEENSDNEESGPSSTIVGRTEQLADESDVKIITPDERDAGSDVKLVVDDEADGSDSGLRLVAEDELPAPEHEADELEGATVISDAEEFSLSLDDDDVPLAEDSSDDISSGPGSDISLSEDELGPSLEDDLGLLDDDGEFSLTGEEDDEGDDNISLADDDLVLESAPGSDITQNTADSGISLADPSQSGLSLEGPLDLGGDEDDLSGDEDDLASLEVASVGGGAQEMLEMPDDDDFLLTPMDEAGESDEEDSGSQVIALDEDSSFAEASFGEPVEMEAIDEGLSGFIEADTGFDDAPAPALEHETELTAAPAASSMTVRSAQYSGLTVTSLCFCMFFLSICGIMMLDLMRSMWSWNTPYSINSTLMDFVLQYF
jgi:excisionase family DNA binding protein